MLLCHNLQNLFCCTFTLPELKKIIYTDDQEDILLFAEYALKNYGKFDTLMCESGAEALEKIDAFNPDLIVLDFMMPKLDGPQTLRKIRHMKLFEKTPAIFITAKIFPNEVEDLMKCDSSVIGLIPKPFDPVTISDSIQSMWDASFSNEKTTKQIAQS